MNTVKFNNAGAKMVAHRGVSGLETENTCSAFVAAGSRSYFGIETDVHVTADGKFIIIHDDDLKRISGDDMKVETSTFDSLRAVTLYNKDGKKSRGDLHPASLNEYIEICKKYEKHAVLELKNAMSAQQVGGIADAVDALGYREHTTFISFSFQNLVYLREKSAEYIGQWLCGSEINDHLEDMKTYRLGCDIEYHCLNEELLKKLHGAGIEVNCWTVDDPETAERLSKWGVDYITSNILE